MIVLLQDRLKMILFIKASLFIITAGGWKKLLLFYIKYISEVFCYSRESIFLYLETEDISKSYFWKWLQNSAEHIQVVVAYTASVYQPIILVNGQVEGAIFKVSKMVVT